ncbi:MAG: hypothetical protein OEV59_00400 [Deltaproteobacteria bacterium]|nr:hypothetical protein [Deltaproteobacteria bacterium]
MKRSAYLILVLLAVVMGYGNYAVADDADSELCLGGYTFNNKSNSAEYEKEVAEAVKDIKESCSGVFLKSYFYELVSVHLKYGNKHDAIKIIKMLLDYEVNIQNGDFVKTKRHAMYGEHNEDEYPKIVELLKSREFLNSEAGKLYTKKLREIEKRRKEAIARIAKSPSDYKPNGSVIVKKGACPGECCSYELAEWNVVEDTDLFDKPNGKKVVARVVKGTPVVALTGEIHVTPVPVMVDMDVEVYVENVSGEGEICNKHGALIRDGEWLTLKAGDVYYLLDYVELGAYNFWYRGCEYWGALGVKERCLFPGEYCSEEYIYPEKRDNMINWVKIKVNDGKQTLEGWTREMSHFRVMTQCS